METGKTDDGNARGGRLREDLASLRLEREPRRPGADRAGRSRGLRRWILPLLLLAGLAAAAVA
ncbi:MAG: hypothetical protein ACKOCT_08055, partial [Alphaproteobacteria bacterium]